MTLKIQLAAGWRLLTHALFGFFLSSLAALHHLFTPFLGNRKKSRRASGGTGRPAPVEIPNWAQTALDAGARDSEKLPLQKRPDVVIHVPSGPLEVLRHHLGGKVSARIEEELQYPHLFFVKPVTDRITLFKLRRQVRNQRILVGKLEALLIKLSDERDALLLESSNLVEQCIDLEAKHVALLLRQSDLSVLHLTGENVPEEITNVV
ncbi:MAG: hypothetical protein H6966_10270 [Chromatiaceae bacterium]|nr:hypothetical protein [Chromatiaceae bacterium]